MKPTLTRRHRRRNVASRTEGAFFKKESQQEQSFFGESSHDPFFQPAGVTAPAIQRKCENCEEEKKVQRVEDKKEEDKKIMKKEDKKEEEKVMRAEEKKEEEKIHRAIDKKEEEKVMKKEDKKEEEKIMKMEDKKEEEKVHKKEAGASVAPGKSVSNYIGSLNGKGNPLPAQSNHFFSSKMGYDFSDVKVHTDKEAAESAKGINAKAYTIGNNVVFNEGQYNTESTEGKKLMAHELTHVVQQQEVMPDHVQRDTQEEEPVCKHENPCPTKFVGKKYALSWGSDTTCSRWGILDDRLEHKPKASASDKKRTCCNHSLQYIQDYVTGTLGLDGAASCKVSNRKKIAAVDFKGNSVRVLCTDTLPSGTGCNQEIELSAPASAKLKSGQTGSLCPITVSYSANSDDSQICETGWSKAAGCISKFCQFKATDKA